MGRQRCELGLLVGGETLPSPGAETLPSPGAGLLLRERSAPASPGRAAGKPARHEELGDSGLVHPCAGFRAGLEACPLRPVRRATLRAAGYKQGWGGRSETEAAQGDKPEFQRELGQKCLKIQARRSA